MIHYKCVAMYVCYPQPLFLYYSAVFGMPLGVNLSAMGVYPPANSGAQSVRSGLIG